MSQQMPMPDSKHTSLRQTDVFPGRPVIRRRELLAAAGLAFFGGLNGYVPCRASQREQPPTLVYELDGPFPYSQYGPSDGIYGGKIISNGRKTVRPEMTVTEFGTLTFVSTSWRDGRFGIALWFRFSEPPRAEGRNGVLIQAALMNSAASVIASQSCKQYIYLEDYSPPLKCFGIQELPDPDVHYGFRFNDIPHTTDVARVRLTLTAIS